VTQKPVYYDKRSEFWKLHFDRALDYDTYLKQSKNENTIRWFENEKRTPVLTEEQRQRLEGYDRELNVLVYAAIWCGDCARQGPMLKKIVDACGEKVRLRVIERNASEDLQDELRILGGLRTPVVVFLSEDWWEVDRFGDRTLSVYRSMVSREVGRGLDRGILSPDALATQLEEWVGIFERVLLMLRLSPFLRKRHED
jgi:thiol-disulfide isomerase/thioredoxin